MDGVKHGFRNKQMQTSVSGVLSYKQDIQGPLGKTGRDEQNVPWTWQDLPAAVFPAEDLQTKAFSIPAWRGEELWPVGRF